MTSNPIGECFDVLQEARTRFVRVDVLTLVDQLLLQRGKETLRHGIIPAVCFATHAAVGVVIKQHQLKCVTAVLAVAIGMIKDQARHHDVVKPPPEPTERRPSSSPHLLTISLLCESRDR